MEACFLERESSNDGGQTICVCIGKCRWQPVTLSILSFDDRMGRSYEPPIMFRLTQNLRQFLFALIAISLMLLPVSGAVAAPAETAMNMEEIAPCPEQQSCCEKGMADCADPFMCATPGSGFFCIVQVAMNKQVRWAELTFVSYDEHLSSLHLIPPRRPPRI
jgi:hypothetical protein